VGRKSGPRVLYVCPDEGIELFGARGCSTHVREMCTAFSQLGCPVKLVVANDEGTPDPSFQIEYELVAPPTSKRIGFEGRKLLYNRRLTARLEAIAGDFGPELIYERYDLYSLAAARVAKSRGIPCVLEVNAPLVKEQRTRLHFPALARIYQRRAFRSADLLVGVSPAICRMLQEVCPSGRVILVENTASVERFSPEVSGDQVRQRLGLEGKRVVGFVGSLKGWQGVSTLIAAASLLVPRHKDLKVVVVGGGRNLESYRRRVQADGLSGTVLMVGPVPHQSVPGFIAAFDVCVAPYMPLDQFYFSPIKLREYMSMRKPIVSSDLPQVSRILEDGTDALLARAGDHRDLAEKISILLEDRSLAERLAASAYSRLEGKMGWRHAAGTVLEAVSGLLAGKAL